MKHLALILAAAVLLMGLVACTPDTTDPDPDTSITHDGQDETSQLVDPPIVGGFSEDKDLDDDDMAIFEEAISQIEYEDVEYEPISVATMVVAGTNYRFTCNAAVDAPDAESYVVYLYAFVSLDGEVELGDISGADVENYDAGEENDADAE